MQDFDDVKWNFFTASLHGDHSVNVYPGEGEYRWQDVCDYVRRTVRDNTTKTSSEYRANLLSVLEDLPEYAGATFVYPNDHFGNHMICIYAYEEGDNPRERAWMLFHDLGIETYTAMGIRGSYSVVLPDVKEAAEAALGTIEMRISLLMEEAGFPRAAPVLSSELKLLSMYDAIEENFNAVKAIALSPLSSDEVRHEACYLTYLIAASLRMDLHAKAKRAGVPGRGNPAISWASKSSTSKEW